MRAPAKQASLSPVEVIIGGIGSAGDGVGAAQDGGTMHVARTLPGERVYVQPEAGGRRATLLAVLHASQERVVPPCPHFAEGCGGCALQHWTDEAYAGWKRGLVVGALERAGFAAPAVGALARTPPHARRRMDFAVERRDHGVTLGLHEPQSERIVDLRACHVLHPALFALIVPLHHTMAGLGALRRRGSVLANLTQVGADLLIRTDGTLAATDRAKLADFARAYAVPRVAWSLDSGQSETAFLQAVPSARFGGTAVALPPGAFLQASAEGEAAILNAVVAALPGKLTGKSRAIELYAGCGTISFPLAAHLRVQAFEGDALAASAVRRAQSGTRVEITERDLVRRPLSAKELSGAALVLLDPPYAGAAMQMPQVAASGVPRIVYVSCNPAALARDAAVLRQAGYRLVGATPIDQFLWSAQVECVAVFETG